MKTFLRWALFALVLLATLIVLTYSLIGFQGRREWAAAQAELRAKGEPLSLAELVPPPIPDEVNFFAAPIWREATDFETKTYYPMGKPDTGRVPKTDPKTWRLQAFTTALENSQRESVLSKNGGTIEKGTRFNLDAAAEFYRAKLGLPPGLSSGETVLQGLDTARAELTEIEAAARRPGARFPIPYEFTVAASVPHISPLLKIAQYLRIRIAAEAAEGKGGDAEDHLFLMFYLADSLQREPLLISQLVRLSILNLAAEAVGEGIARNGWDAGQLQAIQRRLAQVDISHDLAFALRGERGTFNQTIEPLAQGGMKKLAGLLQVATQLTSETPPPPMLENFLTHFFDKAYPRGWVFSDLAYYDRIMQRGIEEGSAFEQPAFWKDVIEPEIIAKKQLPQGLTRLFSLIALPAIGGSTRQFLKTEIRLRQAQIACALERYRLAKGSYPDSLDALVSEYLPALPLDACDQKNFRYQRPAPDQFVLWSIGPDKIDQGGTPPARASDPANDWVWRTAQPERINRR
ncbi:MAG TPA: hypothetical protein VIS74_08185 [Chthoniobacterales bacterium]